MLKVGFDERWVHLAMEMVHIATYLVLINGESKGYITTSHGIKQGDPLSPCAKDLSSLTGRPWRGSSCVAPYLVPMECVYPTYYLQMTASFSAKRRWRRVNTYLIFLEDTKPLPVKPSLDKKKCPFSLAVTKGKRLKWISRHSLGLALWRIVKLILDCLWSVENQR